MTEQTPSIKFIKEGSSELPSGGEEKRFTVAEYQEMDDAFQAHLAVEDPNYLPGKGVGGRTKICYIFNDGSMVCLY